MLYGENFVSGVKVTFGSSRAYVTRISSSQLRAITPAGSGTKNVTVTNPDGKSASLANAFKYVRPSRNQSTATAVETTAAASLRSEGATIAAETSVDAAQISAADGTAAESPASRTTNTRAASASDGLTLFFADGAVNSFFDTHFTLTNPGDAPANVTLTFTDSSGQTSQQDVVVAPAATQVVAARELPALADTSFATRIDADQLVIAERTMSWQSSSPSARHDSFGATVTGTLWALADGKAGGSDQAATFVLIANTSEHDGEAVVTLMLDDGSKVSRTVSLPANGRATVATDGPFAVAQGHRFSALVQAIGDTPPQLVVERVTYTAAEGRPWAAASNSVATKLR
jgi:hypothetical protein